MSKQDSGHKPSSHWALWLRIWGLVRYWLVGADVEDGSTVERACVGAGCAAEQACTGVGRTAERACAGRGVCTVGWWSGSVSGATGCSGWWINQSITLGDEDQSTNQITESNQLCAHQLVARPLLGQSPCPHIWPSWSDPRAPTEPMRPPSKWPTPRALVPMLLIYFTIFSAILL
jgi:hypothetical protein